MKRFLTIMAILLVAVSASYAQTGGIKEANLSPDLYYKVNGGLEGRNATGSGITVNQLLYVCGWLDFATTSVASSGSVKKPKLCLADADVAGARAGFMAEGAIANGYSGWAIKKKRVESVNTNGSTIGNPVYLSATAGGWTLTAPVNPATQQIVGRVISVSSTVGAIQFDIADESLSGIGSVDIADGAISTGDIGLKVRASTNLAAGDMVYISSYNATDGFIAALADADVAGGAAQYVATGTITSGATGTVYKAASVTVAAGGAAGDPVYLTITGTTTNTKALAAPAAADAIIQIVGRLSASGTCKVDLFANPVVSIGSNEINADAITSAKIVAGAIVNTDINASAAIDRSKMAENALQIYGIPLTQLQGDDGATLVAAETAGTFNMVVGTNTLLVQGEITDNESETSITYFQFILPPNYVAAGDVTIRLPVALIKTAAATNNASSVDVAVFEQSDAGAVGSDLSTTTAAATFAADDTWYNKDFVITATGLVAGDVLNVAITAVIVDSEAGGGTLRINMAPPKVLIDIKG